MREGLVCGFRYRIATEGRNAATQRAWTEVRIAPWSEFRKEGGFLAPSGGEHLDVARVYFTLSFSPVCF